jgi:hypothetical protein
LGGSCNIPKPKSAGLFDDLPDPEGGISHSVRTLRPNQYKTDQIAEGQIVRGTEEMRAVVGDALLAEGKHSEPLKGLYSFVRQGGGAGFQGVTRNPLERTQVVVKNFKTSSGEVMVAVDLSKLDAARVFDLRAATVEKAFLAKYPKFEKMYNRMAREGVIAVEGHIPVEALTGVVRIPKHAPPATVQAHLEALVGGVK